MGRSHGMLITLLKIVGENAKKIQKNTQKKTKKVKNAQKTKIGKTKDYFLFKLIFFEWFTV